MKKKLIFAGILTQLFLIGCLFEEEGEVSVSNSEWNLIQAQERIIAEGSEKDGLKNILLIAGEGGPSGNMFVKAARTYQKENGGEIYEVHNGDEFIAAVRDFVSKEGKIDHFEYFGHGNEIGLYVNQEASVNGGLYANDPALNKDYTAASIYELPFDVFSKFGWIKFNGCNVAKGFPGANSLAQSFANYFDVDVFAPLGPTEFSSNPYTVDPIENSNYLDPNFGGDIYMVTTYPDKNFVIVEPQIISESGFADVREGQDYAVAVKELIDRGLKLDFKEKRFLPYKNITYGEAKEFCAVVFDDENRCLADFGKEGKLIRNLEALKLLVDAKGVSLKYTIPWYESYVWWAKNEGLLTRDFTNKKWYTRGEMAELSWNFMWKLKKANSVFSSVY